jgi:MOSC domain-containing protein YiiM
MDLKALQSTFAKAGKVVFIGIRPQRRAAVIDLPAVMAIADKGLEGDRYNNRGGARQVTLIQAEHLQSVSSIMGKNVTPEMVRRNIVVAGINILALKGHQFRIGDAVFEYSGECHPCSRMEESLGLGGYNAMRGHGGITVRVIESGLIRINDAVICIPKAN